MKKNMLSKNFLLITLIILLSGCAYNRYDNDAEYDDNAVDVVRDYFESWNIKDYNTMYDQISDGFKDIEPTATTLEDFKNYADSQGIDGVKIISLKKTSDKNGLVTVDYEVEFSAGDKIIPFSGTYTLKYKQDDSTPGYKLIHPYGDKIDKS